MQESFANAARRPTWRCLGRELKPLALGHLFHLATYAPHWLDEQTTKLQLLVHLIPAVFICSQHQEKVPSAFRSRVSRMRTTSWALRFRLLMAAKNFVEGSDKKPIERVVSEVDRMEQYIKSNLTPPISARVRQSQDERPLKAPIHWVLASALISEAHIDLDQAKRWSVADIQCFLSAIAERKGLVEIYDQARIDMIRALAKGAANA